MFISWSDQTSQSCSVYSRTSTVWNWIRGTCRMVQQSPLEDIGTPVMTSQMMVFSHGGDPPRCREENISGGTFLLCQWPWRPSGPSRSQSPGDEAFEDVFVLLSQRPSHGPGTADGTVPVLDPLVQDGFGSKTWLFSPKPSRSLRRSESNQLTDC